MLLAVAVLAGVVAGLLGGWLGERISAVLGLYGRDFFKPWRREPVPEAGGAGLALLLAASYLALYLATQSVYLLAAGLLAAYTLIVGLADDLWRMDPVTKPLLTMASAAIPYALGAYDPRIYLPVYDHWARLTLVYPAILPLLLGVSANAVNMVDVVNGSAPTAALTAALALIASACLASAGIGWSPDPSALAAAVLFVVGLAVYLLAYNRYPARVFNGDSGSLTMGAILGYTAAILKQEAVYLVAIAPLILNGFQIVATVRGFAERRQIPRPVKVGEDGVAYPVCDPRTPPTLVQLLLVEKPMQEKEIYEKLMLLYLLSATAAVAAAALYYLVL